MAALCDTCKTFFQEREGGFEFGKEYPYRKTGKDLYAAAVDGCYICSYLWEGVPKDVQELTLQYNEQESAVYEANQRGQPKWVVERFEYPERDLGNVASVAPGSPSQTVHVYELFIDTLVEFRSTPFALIPTTYMQASTRDHEIAERTDSAANWILVKKWLQDCTENHTECSRSYTVPKYPTRLIHIGVPGDDLQPRLCLTADCLPTGPYATLSYCWGNPLHIPKLTTSNLHELCAGFALSALPKTYVDAILTARNLNIRWLWIDSLCIIQDSPNAEDWQRESSKMADVYQNSFLTIAALDATDATGGCFFLRNPAVVEPPQISPQWGSLASVQGPYSLMPERVWGPICEFAPLARRGWCLQERLLSTRILYFGKKQIYWECLSHAACEMSPNGLPQVLIDSNRMEYFFKHRDHSIRDESSTTVHSSSPELRAQLDSWDKIVEAYCRCGLTKPNDKLVALSGLARRMQSTLGDDYLGGLWRQQLPKQLCWIAKIWDGVVFRPSYRAPSWSWASVEGPIHCPALYFDDVAILISVIEAQVTPVDPKNYFGQIMDGFLRVRGKVLLIDISQHHFAYASKDYYAHLYGNNSRQEQSGDANAAGGSGVKIRIQPDESEQVPEEGLYFLPVLSSDYTNGLMLRCMDVEGERRFSRKGFVYVERNCDNDYQELLKDIDESIITII